MATKRMCDTGLYDKEWFQQLDPKYKLFWEFITKKCDHAGVWDVNLRMLPIQIGFKYDKEELLGLPDFQTRILEIDEDKWLVLKHVKFQCGDELNENSPFHKAVLKNLDKYNLTYEGGKVTSLNGVKKESTTKSKPKSTKFTKPTLQQVKEFFIENKFVNAEIECEAMFLHYESNGWKVGRNKMVDWQAAARNWNQNRVKGTFEKTKDRKREKYVEESQGDAAW